MTSSQGTAAQETKSEGSGAIQAASEKGSWLSQHEDATLRVEGPEREDMQLHQAGNGQSQDDDNDHAEDEDQEGRVSDNEYPSEDHSESSDGCYGPRVLATCKCGHVTYEDEDEDESDEDSYDSGFDGYPSGCFLRSYRHHIECPVKDPFPFEKLPPEIRLMVYHMMMPDDRTQPLHEQESDWNDEYDTTFAGDYYVEPKQSEVVPTSLFRMNKMISAETLALFRNEYSFRMDITPFGIHARGHCTKEDGGYHYSHLKQLSSWRPFDNHRNFHLNLRSDAVRWAQYSNQDPLSYREGHYNVKEWLRLVCDELSIRPPIQNLSITAPCRCALANRLPKDKTLILDLFTPLKRICVLNQVSLSLHYDRKSRGIQYPCARAACGKLRSKIQVSLGRLEGEPLDAHESTWKELKDLRYHDKEAEKKGGQAEGYTRDRGRSDWSSPSLEPIWSCLNGYDLEGSAERNQ